MTGYLAACDKVPEGFIAAHPGELRDAYAIPSAFRYFTDYIHKTK